jgi:hypothetical protein
VSFFLNISVILSLLLAACSGASQYQGRKASEPAPAPKNTDPVPAAVVPAAKDGSENDSLDSVQNNSPEAASTADNKVVPVASPNGEVLAQVQASPGPSSKTAVGVCLSTNLGAISAPAEDATIPLSECLAAVPEAIRRCEAAGCTLYSQAYLTNHPGLPATFQPRNWGKGAVLACGQMSAAESTRGYTSWTCGSSEAPPFPGLVAF